MPMPPRWRCPRRRAVGTAGRRAGFRPGPARTVAARTGTARTGTASPGPGRTAMSPAAPSPMGTSLALEPTGTASTGLPPPGIPPPEILPAGSAVAAPRPTGTALTTTVRTAAAPTRTVRTAAAPPGTDIGILARSALSSALDPAPDRVVPGQLCPPGLCRRALLRRALLRRGALRRPVRCRVLRPPARHQVRHQGEARLPPALRLGCRRGRPAGTADPESGVRREPPPRAPLPLARCHLGCSHRVPVRPEPGHGDRCHQVTRRRTRCLPGRSGDLCQPARADLGGHLVPVRSGLVTAGRPASAIQAWNRAWPSTPILTSTPPSNSTWLASMTIRLGQGAASRNPRRSRRSASGVSLSRSSWPPPRSPC